LFKVYTIYSLKYMGGHQNVYYKTVLFFFGAKMIQYFVVAMLQIYF